MQNSFSNYDSLHTRSDNLKKVKVFILRQLLLTVLKLTNVRPTVPSFYVLTPLLSVSAPFYTGIKSYLNLHGKEGSRNKDSR